MGTNFRRRLGIDPGYTNLGWALYTEAYTGIFALGEEVVREYWNTGVLILEGNLGNRLIQVWTFLNHGIANSGLEMIAIEQLKFGAGNVITKLGQVISAITLFGALRQIPVIGMVPSVHKKSVLRVGRPTKEKSYPFHYNIMVAGAIDIHKELTQHEYDAAGVALTSFDEEAKVECLSQ